MYLFRLRAFISDFKYIFSFNTAVWTLISGFLKWYLCCTNYDRAPTPPKIYNTGQPSVWIIDLGNIKFFKTDLLDRNFCFLIYKLCVLSCENAVNNPHPFDFMGSIVFPNSVSSTSTVICGHPTVTVSKLTVFDNNFRIKLDQFIIASEKKHLLMPWF